MASSIFLGKGSRLFLKQTREIGILRYKALKYKFNIVKAHAQI